MANDGIKRGGGHADFGIGGGDVALGGADVGPLAQQFGRHGNGNRRRFRQIGLIGNRGTGRDRAREHGERVDEFDAGLIEFDAVRLGGGDFGLGAGEIEAADGSGVAAFGEQIEGLAADFQRAVEHRAVGIHGTQRPIGLGHVAGDAEPQRVEHFLGGASRWRWRIPPGGALFPRRRSRN